MQLQLLVTHVTHVCSNAYRLVSCMDECVGGALKDQLMISSYVLHVPA